MRLAPEQLVRMWRLLDEIIDLDEPELEKFLENLSPENQDIKEPLREALQDERNRVGADLDRASLPALSSDLPSELTGLKIGDRVGPWLLMHQLGRGGMAEVWFARRDDGEYKREVALKVPSVHRLRAGMAKRFAWEQNILASLEHPNIARMYDAGKSAAGLPYLAMQYVEGDPLVDACDKRRMGLSDRLKVFLQVLAAVQFAHDRRVIHRDIKPSNILLTPSGTVQLLDFGVAKLLSPDYVSPEETRKFGRALTPDYVAPEVVRGRGDIGPPADVYSLGVVLYELLCGRRPYSMKTIASLNLLERAIFGATIERPSTRVAPDAAAARGAAQDELSRHLRGDLDEIVLRTLAKTPEERYRTVAALASDVERFLKGKAATLRPGATRYRLRDVIRFISNWLNPQTPPQLEGKVRGAQHAAGTPFIAVLPFADMSENKDQEYFADGLTEELIARLTHTPGLRVISRSSSFYFKGKPATIGEIAEALSVGHVLEGSVRKAGNALRITARLIDAKGLNLWSQIYDRQLSDIFALQAEIAQSVAGALAGILDLSYEVSASLGSDLATAYTPRRGSVDRVAEAPSIPRSLMRPPAARKPMTRSVSPVVRDSSDLQNELLRDLGALDEDLGLITMALKHFVGQKSKRMVQKAARNSKDYAEMIRVIAQQLPDADRHRFLLLFSSALSAPSLEIEADATKTGESLTPDYSGPLLGDIKGDIFGSVGDKAGLASDAVALSGAESEGRLPDQTAYSFLLRGNYLSNRGAKEHLERAISAYEMAIHCDSDYALAWTKLAWTRVEQVVRGWISVAEAGASTRSAVERALAIDPKLSEAHKVLGKIQEIFDWNWVAARLEYQKALELDPQDLDAAHCLAHLTDSVFGRLNEDIVLLQRMLERDPLDAITQGQLAAALFSAGYLQEAGASFRRLLQVNPMATGANFGLGMTLLYLDRSSEAIDAVEKEADEIERLCGRAIVSSKMGQEQQAQAALAMLKEKDARAYRIAGIYAYRGEITEAFQWLDRAYQQRDSGMADVRSNPLLRNLQPDPRFYALLAKLKLDTEPLSSGGPFLTQLDFHPMLRRFR